MANIKSSIKRARQNIVRRAHNVSMRSKLRTYIKKVLKAIETKDATKAAAEFKITQSVIDKMAGKGIIHANTAARNKHRLNAKIKQLHNKLRTRCFGV